MISPKLSFCSMLLIVPPSTTLPNIIHPEHVQLFSKKQHFLLLTNFFPALSPAYRIKDSRNKRLCFQLPLKDRAYPTKRKIHNTCITVKNNSTATFKKGEVSEGKIVIYSIFPFLFLFDEVVGKVRLKNSSLKTSYCYLNTPVQLIKTI